MCRSWKLATIIAMGLLTGCGSDGSETPVASHDAVQQLIDTAHDAIQSSQTAAGELPATDTVLDKVAELAGRVSEAGPIAGAAVPYVYARECGAKPAQLAAYKRAARVRLEKLPGFTPADFDADFEAGTRLVSQQIRVDGSPLYDVQRTGVCQWAFDVISRQ